MLVIDLHLVMISMYYAQIKPTVVVNGLILDDTRFGRRFGKTKSPNTKVSSSIDELKLQNAPLPT